MSESSDSPHFAQHNLLANIPKVIEYIDYVISNGGTVAMCCSAAITRSPAFLVAYIMQKYTTNCQQALRIVQHKRFCVNLPESFTRQLDTWEALYKAQRIAQPTMRVEGKRGAGWDFEQK